MADIATVWNIDTASGDWVFSPAAFDLVTDEDGNAVLDNYGAPVTASDQPFLPGQGLLAGNDLVTAVLISLFTDATAALDDVIHDGTNDPRGWWADETIGSKIWLRLRSKKSATLLALVADDIRTALSWMIEDEVAASIDVTTEWDSPSRLAAQVVIQRQSAPAISLKFAWAWEGL